MTLLQGPKDPVLPTLVYITQGNWVALGTEIEYLPLTRNQIRVVAFNVPELTQASFLQKNQTLP